MNARIAATACRIGRPFNHGVEPVIREVVAEALDAARLPLAQVDMVVTVASDTIDGMMVPIRAELAGAFGKTYLNVCSAAGHAVSAALAAIESGDAETVLLVGWGAASRLAEADGRASQFDPFYMRPLGASPRVLAALQKQRLLESGHLQQHDIELFRTRMGSVHQSSPAGSLPYSFCDGVVAMVLRQAGAENEGLIVTDFTAVSGSHDPRDHSVDPADWVRDALSGLAGTNVPLAAASRSRLETSGSSLYAEMRAIAAAQEANLVTCDGPSANRTGGGAMAWFGPATGLRVLAGMVGQLSAGAEPDGGLFIDLAGPLGQHVTSIVVDRRGEA